MNKIIKISPELENTIKILAKLDISSFSKDELIALSNGMEGVDDSFKSFLKTWDGTGDIAKQYQQHLSKASSANAKFASTFKTIAANIGIMLAINVAIKAAAKLWDTLNVTVKEQEQKISELKSSYEGLKFLFHKIKVLYRSFL